MDYLYQQGGFENAEEFANKLNVEGSEYKAIAHFWKFIREHTNVVGTDENLNNIDKNLGTTALLIS